MTTLGKVTAVSVSAVKGIPKVNVPGALLVANHGISGDAHAGPGLRQVSLLPLESVEKMRRLGADVAPGSFAENITTVDLDMSGVAVGSTIRIGQRMPQSVCDL